MEVTLMKLVGMIGTAVLSLTLGTIAPAYAQQEQHEQQEDQKAKPTQQEEKKAQPEKAAKQEEKPAAGQQSNAKQEEKNTQQPAKNTKQEEGTAQQPKAEKQVQRASSKPSGRIPDARFKANFGREHTFHVSQAEYNGGRRFQYGGYWFGFVDSWPSNWLYTQDVFVVEINGVYYLCNPAFPGVNITLNVVV
jgi:hypothetical protein